LIKANHELWLVNQSGEQYIEIRIPEVLNYQNLEIAVSPSGEHVAFNGKVDFEHSDLYLWATVDGGVELIAELFTGCSANQEDDECADMYAATGGMAWSHDGNLLAFTGAHLGSSSDLYVYDLDNGEIQWLTDGPAQTINPIWSLDDTYILHAAVDRLFFTYSGSGNEGWRYYSAEPDGSKNHTLAVGSVEGQVDEEYLGWVSDHMMLLHSEIWYCGYFDLRMINVANDEEYLFWHGNYHGLVYNPEIRAALVYVDPNAAETDVCGPIDKAPGLYLVTIPDNKQTLLDMDPWNIAYTSMSAGVGYGMVFIWSSDGFLGISADGNYENFTGNPNLPEEYWDFGMVINEIYGWVSPGG